MSNTLLKFVTENKTVLFSVGAITSLFLLTKLLFRKKKKSTPVLDPKNYKKFELIKVIELTTNVPCPVKLFRFKLPDPSSSLELPIGKHIWLKFTDPTTKEEVRRSYTPSSTNSCKGHFDLVVKIYPQGKMTQFLDKMKIGEKIDICGPKGEFKYQPGMTKKFGMLAGGSGITPMLQIIKEILVETKGDKTELVLLYGSLTEKDIILREEIDDLAKNHKNFKVYHVITQPENPEKWKSIGGTGFINEKIIKDHFGSKSENLGSDGKCQIKILLCGPPMMNKVMKDTLLKSDGSLGYAKEDLFTF